MKRTWVRPLHVLVVAVLLSACAQEQTVPRIAVLVGRPGMDAAQLAAQDINRGAGQDSIEVDILERFYNTSAEDAIDVARELAADTRTLAVVGHNNSASSLAAAQIYNAERIVQIAPTSTAPAYSSVGEYSFRMVPDDRHQARTLAEIAARAAPNRRIAIGYANDDYGRGLLHEVQPLLEQAGVAVVLAAPHREPADTLLLRRFASDLARARPDLLLWLGRAPPLQILLSEPAIPPVLGSDGVELGVLASGDVRPFRGVRYTRFIDPATTDARFRQFAERYQAMGRARVNSEAIYVYDAIHLLAAHIRAGGNTRAKLRDRLARVGNGLPAYQGLGGAVAFDRNGDVARSYLLALVTDTGVVAVPLKQAF